ncbi:MAG: hypothetical protein ACR2PR_12160 [Pseudohongiellaceae bacterium]
MNSMYEKIRAAVEGEFGDVDAFITEQLQSRVPLVENIGHYIVAAGGKRLRRGRPTVNAEWDNPSSVLVDDFIYSRAFHVLVGMG